MKILFVAPMPPPVTGQSLACELLLNSLREAGHDVELIDINKRNFQNGGGSLSRILDIPKILFLIAKKKSGRSLVYFNPSESVTGNLKDLLIYATLGRHLSSTFIHMHGGAGMRKLLSPAHKWLFRINSWFLRRMGG